MTGRLNYTPEARRQLHELDAWISEAASTEIATRFVTAVMAHIDGILAFPLAGRARDDIRPGMRTTTYQKRTLIAYEMDESRGKRVVTIIGIFHGGQDWESALSGEPEDPAEG